MAVVFRVRGLQLIPHVIYTTLTLISFAYDDLTFAAPERREKKYLNLTCFNNNPAIRLKIDADKCLTTLSAKSLISFQRLSVITGPQHSMNK